MNEQFKVGTICIGQNFTIATEYNNMECEIIGGLAMRGWKNSRTGESGVDPCYDVRWANGKEMPMAPFHLRRKPPKQSDKDWAEGKVREITQESVHVASGAKHLIPEEA